MKIQNLLTGLTGALLLALPVARAQNETAAESLAAKPAISGTASVFARSSYLWNGLSFADRAVLQSELTLEFRDAPGLFVSLWNSNGFDRDLSGDYDDEIDLTVGYALNLSEKLSLTVRGAYYDEPELLSLGTWDVLAAGARLDWQVAERTTAYLDVGCYWTRGVAGQDGWVAEAGVATSALGIDWTVGVIVDDGPFGYSRGAALKVSAAKSWKLGERWTLVLPEVVAFLPLRGTDARDACAAVGCGLRFTF